MVASVDISRYEEPVIATTIMLVPNGPVTDDTVMLLGALTGQMIGLMNSD